MNLVSWLKFEQTRSPEHKAVDLATAPSQLVLSDVIVCAYRLKVCL
jgi:hypothetical protein